MAPKEEDGNVNADGNLAEAGEMDELLQEISDVLRSQGFFLFFRLLLRQCIYLTTDTSSSCSQGVDRSIQNISSDQGSEN
ncbi:hypothetical protein YC2023_107068 [Brassica napus]